MSDQAWTVWDDVLTRERYALMVDRIGRIPTDRLVPTAYQDFFAAEANRLLRAIHIYEAKQSGQLAARSPEECAADQEALWGHLAPARYATSWANPAYAAAKLGAEQGQLISFLSSEMDNAVAYAFQGRQMELTLFLELFVQIYGSAQEEDWQEAREDIGWFFHDYSEIFVENQIHDMLCPDDNFFTDIVMGADLSDPTYLYRYGLPVGENERKLAEFLGRLSEAQIQSMADTYTEGYRQGFVAAGVDLSKKSVVELDFPIGLERVMRAAIENFRAMGLSPAMSREPSSSFFRKGQMKRAVYSTSPNRQYDFDHREDMAYYLDNALVERRLEVYRTVFSQHAEAARRYAGPAVVEVFGEDPFSPAPCEAAIHFSDEQQALCVRQSVETGIITYTYIPGEERSFCIISYPLPEIGPRFEEIFAETVRINTLDSAHYMRMQQGLIDALNGAREAHILGRGVNRTDLIVAIHPLDDPARETAFENCGADVNIPVGEVFTSPVLAGTNGVLHVSEVYLEGLLYRDLAITFTDGMITDYTCANFDSEEENKKYIRDNILMHHDTLPMGEFAIGTNTMAYCMAKKYGIEARMPILIAEKTGPHFAVGDTCYSHEEDVERANPDGKRMVAKENAVSARRNEDPQAAYFNCHTDITIPYEELGSITAVYPDGHEVDIIRDGRFVVPGTEELNRPLEEEERI